jgi:hypothetical protein
MQSLFRKPNPYWWPIFLVYAVAFLMPAWFEGGRAVYGWQAFLMGITGFVYVIIVPHVYVVWMANLILWCALLALRGHLYRRAAILAGVGFALGCLFPFVWWSTITLGPGYFIWLGSMAALTLLSVAFCVTDEPRRRSWSPYWSRSEEALDFTHDDERAAPANAPSRQASTAFRAD